MSEIDLLLDEENELIFELNIEIKGYDNSDMYVGLTKAIKQIKEGK